MSSSAVLVSNLTDTNLFTNIKNMFQSSVIPFILSIGFYYEFSNLNPLKIVNINLTNKIIGTLWHKSVWNEATKLIQCQWSKK